MKPIIFSVEDVRAIMDGRKTMTRRVVKFPKGNAPHWYHGPNEDGTHEFMFGEISNGCCLDWSDAIKAPYKEGDVLWVRETWGGIRLGNGKTVPFETEYWYKADSVNPNPDDKWGSPLFMPLAAARLFLRVTWIRAERIQDISRADAIDEGFVNDGDWGAEVPFEDTWNDLNAKRGYGWDTNCWVFVISFERIERPKE